MRTTLRRVLRGRARAQGVPWFIGAILLVILTLGLIEDGMLLFAAHRRAELLAESAARAGASQLDQQQMCYRLTVPPCRIGATTGDPPHSPE